ncbi:WW domain-binding protein 11 [Diaphorina citri]|uniref:WW domain-binding protein 11 n=1 Tax=Diaphorina citri TaxID=121845 RepID=A0A1S3D6Z1_DIACI|nr:WW domain-binding protein 11 [Diaphorina citri]
MGRRSINTTKSGKYMNPTDQARKEARKKELKKNKKQRMLVRTAVLKGKDPQQLLLEMEKIDQMEYNVLQPSPLNEKVLKDKRRKLRDTFDRVMKMYVKDDPDKWEELKRGEVEYEKRRTALISYYEAVKHAQQVQVDDIPLPLQQLPPGEELKRGEVEYEKRRTALISYYEAVKHAQQVQVDDIPLPLQQLPPESLAALAAGYTSQIPLPSDLGIPLPPSILGNLVPPPPEDRKGEIESVTSRDGKTITAKPKIRNLSADLTRFVPTTLRMKKGDDAMKRTSKPAGDTKTKPDQTGKSVHTPTVPPPAAPGQTKDDAYLQFMKEMQGLL